MLNRLGWAAALLLALAAPTAAAEGGDLYTAYAIVTGTDMRQRPWGFAQCLREVLVKLSGDPRLQGDPRVAALAEHADRLVAAFDYVDLMAAYKKKDDQGSYDRPHRLTVHFDPAKIDAALAQLGETPWRGDRPVVVPVLLVHGPKPPPYLLTTEEPRAAEQRGSLIDRAGELGLAAHIPSTAELAAWHIAADSFPLPEGELPASQPSEAVVLGTLDWSEALPGWIGAWHLRWRGADHAWGIRGVNYDAAFRDMVGGVMLLASGHVEPD